MNSETYIRTQSRGAAVQAYHAMLAALHEKSRTFSFAQPRIDAGFPFRDNLCREVALLACGDLNSEDTQLVFEFLGLTPFILFDLGGTSLECNAADDCPASVHLEACSKFEGPR